MWILYTVFLSGEFFNLRSHKGNDKAEHFTWETAMRFQSTFPQGERPFRCVSPFYSFLFQSTFPQGERPFHVYLVVFLFSVSIHVPTRGTTKIRRFQGADPDSFNPRSHKGNDPHHLWICLDHWRFNPRSHKGNDSGLCVCDRFAGSFNPRSHKGNDSNSPQIHPSFFSTNHQFLLYTPI